MPEKETSALVPSNVTPASVMLEVVRESVKKDITAPVEAGEVLGQAKVYYAGAELATVNLVAAQTVERSFTGFIMSKLSDLVGSTGFMVLTILLFFAAAGYLGLIMSRFYGWDKKLVAVMAEKNGGAKKTTPKKAPQKKAPAKRPAPSKSAPKKQAPKNFKK